MSGTCLAEFIALAMFIRNNLIVVVVLQCQRQREAISAGFGGSRGRDERWPFGPLAAAGIGGGSDQVSSPPAGHLLHQSVVVNLQPFRQ